MGTEAKAHMAGLVQNTGCLACIASREAAYLQTVQIHKTQQ